MLKLDQTVPFKGNEVNLRQSCIHFTKNSSPLIGKQIVYFKSCLSFTLFAIFINDSPKRNKRNEEQTLLFADDDTVLLKYPLFNYRLKGISSDYATVTMMKRVVQREPGIFNLVNIHKIKI